MLGILPLVQNKVLIISAQQKRLERVTFSTRLWIYLSQKSIPLTLFVEFPDDGVQVGVLERDMTASHRHFAAERGDSSNT